MASLNKATLIGHLGSEPEIRYMPSGDAVANVSLATTESWRDKASGEQKESTEWHRLTMFGRLAEIAQQYLHKGSMIYVEGRIKTKKYTDKDGIERYSTGIEVTTLKMLGGKSDGQQTSNQAAQTRNTTVNDLEDDIPF